MELNVEQIIKALECCKTESTVVCLECPYRAFINCESLVRNDALALINSQEQRIKELETENVQFRDEQRKLIKEVEDWKAIAEQYQKQFEDCAEDRAKLTEENEAWQKALITEKENAGKAYYELACEVEDLRAENERLRGVGLPDEIAKEMLEEG